MLLQRYGPQLINLLAAVLLLLTFAMLTRRRILSLINLFAAQGLVLALSTALVAALTGQMHLYGSALLTLLLKALALPWILHRLIRRADVLVENFRPGTMDRLGLGWSALRERYPRLIYAATSGFGQTGPYAQRPAYDVIAQAMGGIMSLTGHEGGPPTRVGSSIGDLGAGLFTALGIVSALHDRTRTGKGMLVDVAMLDSQIALLENSVIRYFASGQSPKPVGARHSSIAPFEPYHARNGYIVIACGKGHEQSMCFGTTEYPWDDRVALRAAIKGTPLKTLPTA